MVLNLAFLVGFCAFAFMLLKAVRSTSITIRPIAVPEILSKRGYTPEAFAARVAAEMARIDRGAKTKIQRGRILGNDDRPDFQLPGQPLSFRALTRYIQELFGIADPVVSVDVTEESGLYIAQVRIVGGPYGGSLDTVSSPASDATDAFVRKVAEAGVRACEPYILAIYKATVEEARCRSAPPCDFSPSLALFDEILSRASPSEREWALLGRSHVFVLLKRYADAAANAERAAALDPRFASAYNNWGAALEWQGRHEEAIEKCRKAAHLDPTYASAYNNWGASLESLGRNEEAIKKYMKATALDPTYASAYNNWGHALRALGRNEEAIEMYRKSADLDPTDSAAYNNWGASLESLGRNEEAVEKYMKATEVDPTYAFAYNNWGNALHALGRNEEAVEKYMKATDLNPKYGLAYRNWAEVLSLLGREEEAAMKRALANEADRK